jgi:tetratricopeptide (TPR) repeat protein
MRGYVLLLAVASVALGHPGRVGAGLYNPAEPVRFPQFADGKVQGLGFARFRDLLTDYLSISVELGSSSSLRKHYLGRRDELLAGARSGRLTTTQAVELSACLIRLRQYDEAVQLLTPLAVQERGNFMILANLGTAHQLAGRLDRALTYLEQIDAVWPEQRPGLNADQLKWYRLAEKYHLRLVRSRLKESLRALGARGAQPGQLDELFSAEAGPVRFQGDSGHYEAGKLAARERARLPAEALALVQQLLVWLPGTVPGTEDTRLYWLLGELYNAQGDIAAAGQIFDKCVWTHRFDAADLREHRKIVQAARPEPAAVSSEPTPVAAEPEPSWIPNRRKLLIGGSLAGLVVLVLIYLQLREFLRKRRVS